MEIRDWRLEIGEWITNRQSLIANLQHGMSSNFEWQTEEIAEWPEAAAVASEPKPPSPFRWFRALAVVLLIAAVGWVVYRQVDQRVAEAAAHVEADVLSAHNVVWQAAQQQDVELLETVLSGRDPRWTEAQKTLVEDGRLFDAAALGFQRQPAEADFPVTRSDNITITLSADLTAAEVFWLEPLTIHTSGRLTETVALLHNAVYRRGERSWLLSPPPRDFWGEWQQASGAYISLVYPQRDEHVARRLVHDLDAVVVRVCTQLDKITCPAGLSLRLRLETDARSQLAINDAETMLMSGRSLDLPTPTLVGRPVDEAGYQALVRGYGAHVAVALTTDLVGYNCCRHGLFYRILLDRQLGQLALRPGSPIPADYDQLLADPNLLNPGSLWGQSLSDLPTAAEWMALHSLADFLLSEVTPATPVAEMQRTLGQPVDFSVWMTRFTGVLHDPEAFNAAWLQFIFRQSPSARADLPIPLPKQELQLTCTSQNEGIWLYRYRWDTGDWEQAFSHEYGRSPAFGNIYPLPEKDQYVLQEQFIAAEYMGIRLSIWQDGREVFALEQTADPTSPTYGPYLSGSDPSGRYLVLITSGGGIVTEYQLLDLASCDSGQCETWSVSGRPLWSPDGAQTLLVSEPPIARTGVYRADTRGQSAAAVAIGYWPFWLDDDTYGYLRRSDDEVEVVTAVAGDDSARVLLRAADLLPLIDPAGQPAVVVVDTVLANPANPHQVLIVARATGQGESDVATAFLLQLAAGFDAVTEITPVLQANRSAWSHFSPDGRWLVVATWNTNGRDNIFHLIDLESDRRQTFSSSGSGVVWSANGQWLAQPEDGYLLLRAPAHDYKQLILHDFDNCYSAYWGGGD